MEIAVIACAQQRLRLHESLEDYRRDCVRFLRMAQSKGASLVVFPELSGLMAAAPRLPGVRARLLRQADQGRQRGASLWRRARARVASSTAEILGADFRAELTRYLAENGNALRQELEKFYAELARNYGMTVLVGMGYLPGAGPGQRALAMAFSAQGERLGEMERVGVLASEGSLIEPGAGWGLIQTSVGRVGVLLGPDVLYPEAARLLAYRGADLLVIMAATSDAALAARIRLCAAARAQENQLVVLVSFLIGNNPLHSDHAPFTGRSAIFAPAELTSGYSGVLVEMGTAAAEGLITAEVNPYVLRKLWDEGEASPRRGLPLTLAGQLLAADYTLGRTVEEAWQGVEAARAQTLLLPQPTTPAALADMELAPPAVSVESLEETEEEELEKATLADDADAQPPTGDERTPEEVATAEQD